MCTKEIHVFARESYRYTFFGNGTDAEYGFLIIFFLRLVKHCRHVAQLLGLGAKETIALQLKWRNFVSFSTRLSKVHCKEKFTVRR